MTNREKLLVVFPLETERTIITPMTEEELDAMYRKISEKHGRFSDAAREYSQRRGTINLTVAEKKTGAFCGTAEIQEPDGAAELAVELEPEWQRKELGFEICQRLVQAVFDGTQIPKLQWSATRGNAGSIRLAEKLGAVQIEELSVPGLIAELSQTEAKEELHKLDVLTFVIRRPNSISQADENTDREKEASQSEPIALKKFAAFLNTVHDVTDGAPISELLDSIPDQPESDETCE